MSSGYTIHVAGLAPETTEDKLHDFFSFCGKLTSVKKHGTEADITFEKASAMRTSLMLNGGTLDGAHLEVTSTSPEASTDASKNVLPAAGSAAAPTEKKTIDQEDKPKAAIAAEYLANGYLLGDHVIQRAIDFDHKQGISTRFLSFLGDIDKKAGQRFVGQDKTVSGQAYDHASRFYSTAREADQQHGVSERFHKYYTRAISTPLGQKVSQFYKETEKQVLDVHDEAKRIAAQKKAASTPATPPPEPAAPATETAPVATEAAAAPVVDEKAAAAPAEKA